MVAMNTENSVLYSLIVVVMMAGLFSPIVLAGNIPWFFGQVESAGAVTGGGGRVKAGRITITCVCLMADDYNDL